MVHDIGVQRPASKSSSARRPAASSRPAMMSASILRSHSSILCSFDWGLCMSKKQAAWAAHKSFESSVMVCTRN